MKYLPLGKENCGSCVFLETGDDEMWGHIVFPQQFCSMVEQPELTTWEMKELSDAFRRWLINDGKPQRCHYYLAETKTRTFGQKASDFIEGRYGEKDEEI